MTIENFSWYTGNLDWLPEGTIALAKAGSHAYGTSLPTSDRDYRGVAIAPRRYYLGNLQHFAQAESKVPDVVIMDVRKFFLLAQDCNPNIIELLFTDPRDYVIKKHFWEKILVHRDLFLSQKARHTFSGYGMSQLKKLKSHRRWLFDAPDHKPTRKEFGLPEGEGTLSKDQLDIIVSKIKKAEDKLGGMGLQEYKLENEETQLSLIAGALEQLNLSQNLMPLVYAERRFAAACKVWANYQEHLNTRNANRSELEKKYGYDTKFGMHLVRLMRTGHEILSTGQVIVKRPDAEELLAIRNGAWSFEKLDAWATEMDAELHSMPTNLPHDPDRVGIDRVLVEIIEEFHGRTK